MKTLFTLFFLMKSRIFDFKKSTASCFESQKTVNFQHIQMFEVKMNIVKMFGKCFAQTKNY